MLKKPYSPPMQSRIGQLIDSILLLVFVLVTLFAPLKLDLAGGGKKYLEIEDKSWAGLKQNDAMVAQWQKLGLAGDAHNDVPQETVAMISSRFDYSFDGETMMLTALLIIAYFGIVFHWSKKEYRDVIEEKFGSSGAGKP